MKEFEDIHKLIDEQAQSPYEREALRDLTSLLSAGGLDADPRESFQDELRQRLLAEARRSRRPVPWFRTPLALGAAAAVIVAVVAGAALRGSGFGGVGGQRFNAAKTSASEPQIASAGATTGETYGPAATADSTMKTLGSMEVASVPQDSTAGQYRAAAGDGTSGATAVSRGIARPDVHDTAMVKVEPGAASFTLAANLPVVPHQLSHWTLTSVEVTPQQVAAEARLAGLTGEVQTGFDHLWVGAPLPGQAAPAPDLPPYKQPGQWLVAGREWGNGWNYYVTNDNPVPQASVATATDATKVAREFLQRVGVAPTGDLAVAARFDARTADYWVDWHLNLSSIDVNGVQGSLRVGANGGIRYASWPATAVLAAGSTGEVLQPEEAFGMLRNIPFDWYSEAPSLTVSQVGLAYRWPPATPAGAGADLELVYEFTVHDADGHQAVLAVPAWRP